MEGANLARIVGSIENRTDSLTNLGKLPPHALGYALVITKKANLPPNAMAGEVLLDAAFTGTSFYEKDHNDLVLRSVPIMYLMGMKAQIVQGPVNSAKVIDGFTAMGEGGDPEDWIKAINMALNQKADVDKIFANISGQEKKYVHPDFDADLWPSSGPILNISIYHRESAPEADLTAVTLAMNI